MSYALRHFDGCRCRLFLQFGRLPPIGLAIPVILQAPPRLELNLQAQAPKPATREGRAHER
jgi:hypothetical protein